MSSADTASVKHEQRLDAEPNSEATPVAPQAPAPPPDGGSRAWLAVAGGWLCQFCSFGFINALGSFTEIYQSDILKSESASNISWILTTQLFLMFFLSQPVGVGVDMFGARPMLILSFVLSVAGLIGLSFATQYWQIFLAQSLCFGLGSAAAFIPGLVVAGQYFKKKRALALGIVASGSSCGGVVFPVMLARLFDSIGFRPTMRWCALLIGVLLAIANLLVRPAMPAKGLAGRRNLISFATFKKPTYLFYVSGAFLVFWGLFGPFDYLPAFALGNKSTEGVALYTVSIINASSIPGRILPNMYADRLGSSLKSITLCAFLAGVSVLVIWLPISYHNSLGGLIVFAIVFGFTSGAFVSLMTPAIIEVAGGHSSDLGVMLGTFFVVVALASLTGLPIQTATVTEKADGGGYDMLGLIVFCGVTMLLGSALLGWTARLAGKRKAAAAS
ncbi:hypothetical protein PG994_000983 [Apiospora phragmitis]|uniref:Major facilitator superfamily (MFS) profile domain-containing protein n=1 Tax=Apiospora phragmitis TaxID=2905665 RepID=A0ABR1WR45_9PEZI